jgi:hypothetical protein
MMEMYLEKGISIKYNYNFFDCRERKGEKESTVPTWKR